MLNQTKPKQIIQDIQMYFLTMKRVVFGLLAFPFVSFRFHFAWLYCAVVVVVVL